MTKDDDKTKEQLIDELTKTRLKVQELTQLEARRQRTEEEQIFSRQQLRLLIDAGPDFFFLKDIELRYQLVNSALVRFFGRDEADILGRTDVELMPEEAAVSCQESDRLAIHEKRIVVTTEPVGDSFYETYKFPVIVAGEIVGVAGIIRDTTDRRRAEDALRESEERFRTLCESSRDAILMMAPDGKVSYWNPAAEQMFGYTSTEAVDRNLHELVVPKRHLEAHRVAYAEFLRSGRGAAVGKTLELQAVRKDGSEITVALSLSAERIRDNWNAIGILRDITEQKNAENALREAHRRLDEIIEYLPDATLVIDAQGKVIAWNKAIEQMTGIKAADMLGKGNYEYTLSFYGERRPMLIDFVLQPREEIEAKYVSTERGSKVLEGEAYMLPLRGGEVYLFGRASALQDSKGNIVGAIESIRDITDRRKAEEKYRAIFENAAEGIFQTKPDGRLISVNPAMAGLFGYASPADLIHSVADMPELYANPDDRFSFQREIEAKGTVSQYEIRCVRQDGVDMWIAVNARAIKDKEGNVIRYDGYFADITERKKMENSLKESEERYRMIVENMNDIIWIMDLNFNYKYRSPSKVEITGRTPEEIMAIPPREQIVPESYALAEKILAEELVNEFGGKPVDPHRSRTMELEVYHKNGGTVWIEVIGSFIRDENGKPVEILFAGWEITARKKIEVALRDSEKRYRMIVENMQDTIWTMNLDLEYTYQSPSEIRVTGFTAEEMMQIPVQDQITSESYAMVEKILIEEMALEFGGVSTDLHRTRTMELEVYCKDGSRIWEEVTATFVRDENGRAAEILFAGRDITERRKIQEALKESEKRYRMIVENMNDTIWTMDLNLRYKYISPDSIILTGFTEEEIRTMPLKEQVTPESYARMGTLLMAELALESSGRPINPRGSRTLEIEAYHKDGSTIWVEIDATFDRAENGKPVELVIAGRNITERKKMQKEKETLERQLIQAQKMEAIGTLAGGIAHDFNNILASMMGFTEMAVKETRQNIRGDYLDQVLQACERAKNLVNQILSFSRMQEQERKPLDVRMILKEALGLLRASLPATIEMRQNIAPEEATVLADPTQIHQIIMNLCTNAAQAMWEKGGLLTIHLSPVEIDATGLHPRLDLQPGAYIRLSVDDTGQGIDPAIKDKIFDPFFTTKKTKEGTGLGLSVVYGIVKSYGGAIDVQSSAGKGATFTIYLPCIRLENPAEETSQEEIDIQGHERILFVDDEEMLVKMVRIFFESQGYSITATASSAEALRLFQGNPEGFDLVITDMTMPELTGVELARDLLKIRPDLPIILCTGYSDSINMADARKLNIRAFLQKPLLLKDMGRLVKRLLKN